MNRLTGERTTVARFPSGQVRVVTDNYLEMAKPSPPLADREWRGRTELKLKPTGSSSSKDDKRKQH